MSTRPPAVTRYRFVALAVVWCAYLVVFLSRLCVGPLSPFLKQAFDLSNAQIGGLTSATAIAYAPTLLLAGWLVDRIGVRLAVIVGSLVTGVFVGLTALAPTYGVMFLLLVLSGFGCGFIYPSAIKAVMLWFPARERATAIGVNQAAVNVSGMLGAVIMPALALTVGWQAGFLVAAAMAFAVCAFAALAYHDPPRGPGVPLAATIVPQESRVSAGQRAPGSADAPDPADALAADDSAPAGAPGRAGPPSELPRAVYEVEQGLPLVTGDETTDKAAARAGFLAVLRSRDILLLGLAAMCLCVVEFSAMAHLVLFLKNDWAYTAVAAGGLLALCQGAGAIGKPVSGLVSDRLLGRRRRPALLALCGFAALACVILALAGPQRTGLMITALILLGVGAVGWGGLLGTLAGETAGSAAAGAAAGVTAALDNIGIFVGPPVFGFIVDRTGSYAPAWWAMVAASAAAAVLLLFVHERRHA